MLYSHSCSTLLFWTLLFWTLLFWTLLFWTPCFAAARRRQHLDGNILDSVQSRMKISDEEHRWKILACVNGLVEDNLIFGTPMPTGILG